MTIANTIEIIVYCNELRIGIIISRMLQDKERLIKVLAILRLMAFVRIDAHEIEIVTDISGMLPNSTIVGLPDGAVRQTVI